MTRPFRGGRCSGCRSVELPGMRWGWFYLTKTISKDDWESNGDGDESCWLSALDVMNAEENGEQRQKRRKFFFHRFPPGYESDGSAIFQKRHTYIQWLWQQLWFGRWPKMEETVRARRCSSFQRDSLLLARLKKSVRRGYWTLKGSKYTTLKFRRACMKLNEIEKNQ